MKKPERHRLQILVYDLMAGRWQHRTYTHDGLLRACDQFNRKGCCAVSLRRCPDGRLQGAAAGDP